MKNFLTQFLKKIFLDNLPQYVCKIHESLFLKVSETRKLSSVRSLIDEEKDFFNDFIETKSEKNLLKVLDLNLLRFIDDFKNGLMVDALLLTKHSSETDLGFIDKVQNIFNDLSGVILTEKQIVSSSTNAIVDDTTPRIIMTIKLRKNSTIMLEIQVSKNKSINNRIFALTLTEYIKQPLAKHFVNFEHLKNISVNLATKLDMEQIIIVITAEQQVVIFMKFYIPIKSSYNSYFFITNIKFCLNKRFLCQIMIR